MPSKLVKNMLVYGTYSIMQLPVKDNDRSELFYSMTLEPPLALILIARVFVSPLSIGFRFLPITNVMGVPEAIYVGFKLLIVIC